MTSRVESAKIKSVLKEIEKPFDESKLVTREKGLKYLTDVVDFVLATNMISVGIDISRLNIMVLNGMPKILQNIFRHQVVLVEKPKV